VVRLLSAVLFFYSYTGTASQDPTAPLGWQKPDSIEAKSKKKQQPLPKLQSIVCANQGKCQAVLSDKVVVVGEMVNGFTVSQIEAQLVTLSRGGKQWKLEIFTQDIKY